MQIRWVHIKNYRSCRDVKIDFESLHALVGANNAGKSSLLRALDFLINPSTTKIDEETFWSGDKSLQIWIEAVFDRLTDAEEQNEQLTPYLKPDGTFHIARSVRWIPDETEPEAGKADIGQHYCKLVPIFEWLQGESINGKNIEKWWKDKDNLQVKGTSFVEFLATGTKPKVSEWQEKAKEFVTQYLTEDNFEEKWIGNPRGYAGVLKGKAIGVRPTQLTIKQSALQKFRPSYDLFQNLHEC